MISTFIIKTGVFLSRARRALGKARRGNVAMIFAISALPVLIAGGSGIDMARALAVRGKLYTAVDAAALAVASKVGITEAQAEVLAQQYFNANYKLDNSFGTPNPIDVTITGQKVTVTSNIAMPTTLMNVAGIQNVNLTASSEVVWGQTKIWIGLALDNTGSMCAPGGSPCPNPVSNSKLYALKEGTKGILNLFENVAANPGDVRVSLIPFAKDVNAGVANVNANWVDWTEWDAANGVCTIANKTNKTACESATVNPTCSIAGKTTKAACESAHVCTIGGAANPAITTQAACTVTPVWTSANACTIGGVVNASILTQNACTALAGTWATTNVCRVSGVNVTNPGITNAGQCTALVTAWTAGVWSVTNGVWTPAPHVAWNGCVADRGLTTGPSSPAYDASNASPNATPESKFPAEQWAECPSQLSPLGYNWAALRTSVDGMVGRGNTNQSIGLAWAWQSLSTGLPLNAPSVPTNTTRHIIILSDGENTQNRWSSNRATIDTRMQAVCSAAKADGVIIWSIFVDVGGAGSATSMEQCATGGASGGHYIPVRSAAEIVAALNVIAQQITNLRVAH